MRDDPRVADDIKSAPWAAVGSSVNESDVPTRARGVAHRPSCAPPARTGNTGSRARSSVRAGRPSLQARPNRRPVEKGEGASHGDVAMWAAPSSVGSTSKGPLRPWLARDSFDQGL
jgi:hypothetical protein